MPRRRDELLRCGEQLVERVHAAVVGLDGQLGAQLAQVAQEFGAVDQRQGEDRWCGPGVAAVAVAAFDQDDPQVGANRIFFHSRKDAALFSEKSSPQPEVDNFLIWAENHCNPVAFSIYAKRGDAPETTEKRALMNRLLSENVAAPIVIEVPDAGDAPAMAAKLPDADEEKKQKVLARIKQRMADLRLTQSEVARRSGIPTTTVHRILYSESKVYGLSMLRAFAIALECPVAWLSAESDTLMELTPATVRLLYVAQAGAYMQMREEPPAAEVQDLPPNSKSLASLPRFGVRVEDDHLAGLQPPVTRGHIAYCVDFAAGNLDVESGRIYLIHRNLRSPGPPDQRREQSSHRETTFWRAQLFRDRVEFAPVTVNADYNHAETFALARPDLYSSDEIEIVGLFYKAAYDYI